ncbi:MAG: hypothetical protein PHN79_04250 [Methanoregula sp.]|nr:hypothetical protein [Methanoregula sp.]
MQGFAGCANTADGLSVCEPGRAGICPGTRLAWGTIGRGTRG